MNATSPPPLMMGGEVGAGGEGGVGAASATLAPAVGVMTPLGAVTCVSSSLASHARLAASSLSRAGTELGAMREAADLEAGGASSLESQAAFAAASSMRGCRRTGCAGGGTAGGGEVAGRAEPHLGTSSLASHAALAAISLSDGVAAVGTGAAAIAAEGAFATEASTRVRGKGAGDGGGGAAAPPVACAPQAGVSKPTLESHAALAAPSSFVRRTPACKPHPGTSSLASHAALAAASSFADARCTCSLGTDETCGAGAGAAGAGLGATLAVVAPHRGFSSFDSHAAFAPASSWAGSAASGNAAEPTSCTSPRACSLEEPHEASNLDSQARFAISSAVAPCTRAFETSDATASTASVTARHVGASSFESHARLASASPVHAPSSVA
mmetsp:Transcript_32994/g.86673  ORF Transcript_32994/g.86673 Transcript_32994/m.86673 type:complete len:385 (-) Transcript_32994:965-2119(-)